MRGYKINLFIIGSLTVGVFFLIWGLNRADSASVLSSRAKKGNVNAEVAVVDIPKNILLAPLQKDGNEIAAIVGDEIHVLLPDPKSPQSVMAVIDAVAPQALTWMGDDVYWIEKRVVKESSSRRSENSYVLVEGVFGMPGSDGRAVIKKRDVYRSEKQISELESSNTGQLLSFVEGEGSEQQLFVFAQKTGEVQRIAQDPVSVAWSPNRAALVVASEQSPRPKTTFFELSSNGEIKTRVDLPEQFGGYGLVFINEGTVGGLVWSTDASAQIRIQTVDLRSNSVIEIGAVADNSDARPTKEGIVAYPKMQIVTEDKSVLITVPDRVNSIYLIESKEQSFLRIGEQPIGVLTEDSVLVQRDFDLFSVALKSGIQTTVVSDISAAALRQ